LDDEMTRSRPGSGDSGFSGGSGGGPSRSRFGGGSGGSGFGGGSGGSESAYLATDEGILPEGAEWEIAEADKPHDLEKIDEVSEEKENVQNVKKGPNVKKGADLIEFFKSVFFICWITVQ
jgi:hypothetical protein